MVTAILLSFSASVLILFLVFIVYKVEYPYISTLYFVLPSLSYQFYFWLSYFNIV